MFAETHYVLILKANAGELAALKNSGGKEAIKPFN
jgi:hypothetical protein